MSLSAALSNLPVIGAALSTDALKLHRDWILERQRDIEIQSFIDPKAIMEWRAEAGRLKDLLHGHSGRRGLHGPFIGFKIDAADPDIVAVAQKRFSTALDICEELSVTQMVIHSPISTWDHNNQLASPKAREAQTAQVHALMSPVLRRAEAIGCTLVIENVEDKDPMARVALAKSFGSPRMKVSLDTGHAHYAHVTTGAPPVDAYVSAAGDMLEHIHIQDADGFADRHWHPGEGTVNWIAVFRTLTASAPQARLLIEVKDPTGLQNGAKYLAGLGVVV